MYYYRYPFNSLMHKSVCVSAEGMKSIHKSSTENKCDLWFSFSCIHLGCPRMGSAEEIEFSYWKLFKVLFNFFFTLVLCSYLVLFAMFEYLICYVALHQVYMLFHLITIFSQCVSIIAFLSHFVQHDFSKEYPIS